MSMKGSLMINPIDLIAGGIIIIGGIAIIFGYINLGSLIAGLGLIIELVKVLIREGLK